MNTDDFKFLVDRIKDRSGIVLSADKGYLIESRLVPVAQRNGLTTVEELVKKMRAAPNAALMEEVTEAMTTNESFFFRDKTPFDFLKDYIVPQFLQSRGSNKRLNIWCAAASTGQEPYSIAMVLKEMNAKMPGWSYKILGTDLSNDVLEKAKAGTYSQFEVQRGLPINLLVKYFKQTGETWMIDPAIRAMVEYKYFNLLESFVPLGKFDVIYLRNVLIYFDRETKKSILERAAQLLAPDGYIILGAAETVIGITDALRPLKTHRGLYERSSAAAGTGLAGKTTSALAGAASGRPSSVLKTSGTATGRR